MWLAEKGGNVYSHPYDLGAYENLVTVFLCSLFIHDQWAESLFFLAFLVAVSAATSNLS